MVEWPYYSDVNEGNNFILFSYYFHQKIRLLLMICSVNIQNKLIFESLKMIAYNIRRHP